MAIEITDQLVAHVARLARLGISPAEAAEMKGHFQKILDFVKVLDGLDLSGVDPSFFPLSTSNVFRADEKAASLPVEKALSNAPQARGGFFLVPRIVSESSALGTGASGTKAASAEEPEEFA